MKYFTLVCPCNTHGSHAVDALEIAPGLAVHRGLDDGEPGGHWCVAHAPSGTTMLFSASEGGALRAAQAIASFTDYTRSGRALENDIGWKERMVRWAVRQGDAFLGPQLRGSFAPAFFGDPTDGNRHVDVRSN